MPWPRTRPNKVIEDDSRRHTVFNPTDYTMDNDSLSLNRFDPGISDTQVPIPIRNSIASLSAVNERPLIGRGMSPPMQEKSPKHQRFSMLRLRHASDSQLAKTAKEQAASVVPPVPARKYTS